MKTYLRLINPIIAIIILLLCLVAATYENGKFKPGAIFEGGIPTYFVAKGLFCGAALFVLGKILESILNRR